MKGEPGSEGLNEMNGKPGSQGPPENPGQQGLPGRNYVRRGIYLYLLGSVKLQLSVSQVHAELEYDGIATVTPYTSWGGGANAQDYAMLGAVEYQLNYNLAQLSLMITLAVLCARPPAPHQ